MSYIIPGLEVFKGQQFDDHRGWFTELFNDTKMPTMFPHGIRQVSRSFSRYKVIRGLHFQTNPPMNKLIHVIDGTIMLYVVDIDPYSENFGKFETIEMPSAYQQRVFIPGHCAVGFEVLYDATIEYFHSATRNDSGARTIKWDDPDINIPWLTTAPILSENDKFKGMSLRGWAQMELTIPL